MIARCPQCQTRYRVAREKIGKGGARIRCTQCTAQFKVALPEEPSDPPVTEVTPAAEARVLLAESDAEAAKAVASFLSRWGLACETVSDGAEALLRIHRSRPPCAILGGHLSGLNGPAIAEIVRRTSELAEVKLIRVAPLDEPVGAPEFEADHTLEPGDLPEGLSGALERLGLGQPPLPEPEPVAVTPSESGEASVPAPSAPAVSSDPEIAAAERLARIIVSDIILYNEAKFVAAARENNLAGALDSELREGHSLFDKRIPEEVRSKRDFLLEELHRQAEKRGIS